MKIFSDLLLELYRLAQDAPAAEFQTRVLDAVREKLAFDSALWATGVIGPEGATPHAIFVYRQPLDMMEKWRHIKPRDTLIYEAFNNLGRTVNAALGSDSSWQARLSTDMMAHIRRYGMEHTLMTMISTPILRLYTAVSFYRADPGQPFTETQRLLKQNLTPHLAEAWNINRFGFVNSARNNEAQPSHGQAICDSKGMLYNTDRNFTGFMLAEWPEWNGPQLPAELLKTLSGNNPRRYAGRHTVISVETLNNLELLNARKTSAIDVLSTRERDVASLFAKGADYRAIADALHIAPVTVRNHLQHIYIKLSVTSKIELARLVNNN
ncbi:MAG: LuxR family transcriptional regulator [Gallionellaceae bacterium]|nr:MAG: LuxR family transcriptional regulator [Gallionellaceae bacterium]